MGVVINAMPYIRRCAHQQGRAGIDVTLLELVQAIGNVTDDDCEIVATVLHLVRSGRVRLIGNFRGCVIDAS